MTRFRHRTTKALSQVLNCAEPHIQEWNSYRNIDSVREAVCRIYGKLVNFEINAGTGVHVGWKSLIWHLKVSGEALQVDPIHVVELEVLVGEADKHFAAMECFSAFEHDRPEAVGTRRGEI